MKLASGLNFNTTNTINIKDGEDSISFIVMHKDTIYAGDLTHNEIIVIKDSIIQYIQLDNEPWSGIIISSSDMLAVGSDNKCVYMIDLVSNTITNIITL